MAGYVAAAAADEVAIADLSEGMRSRVWLDLREKDAQLPDGDMLSSFGGVIVDNARFSEIMSLGESLPATVTYSLSSSLDIGTHDFPDLETLATIQDEMLLEEFLKQYVEVAATFGIDFLLMPNSQDLTPEEMEVLEKLDQFAPEFVIAPTFNRIQDKWKKKELAQHLTNDELMLTHGPLNKRLAKTLQKIDRKITPQQLYVSRRPAKRVTQISTGILQRIYDEAIVYGRKQAAVSIPYEQPDLYLLTDEPFGHLRQELERYYTVHNVLEEHPAKGSMIVVDARSRADYFGPILAQYDPDYHILALISGETHVPPQADEYLYFPENHYLHDRKIPQILYGAAGVNGRLVGASLLSDVQYHRIPDFGKLRYMEPDWVGLSNDKLRGIESLVEDMIEQRAAPGCQVTVIKDGAIVYDKAFGYLTYDSLLPVHSHTLFDVASVTKVMTTLLSVMHLYEQGHFQLDDSISLHLPQYEGSNKGHITIRQLLAHHSGLRSYEALWRRKFSGDLLEPFSYASEEDSVNDIRSYGLPIHPVMADSIRSWLVQSPLLKKRDRYHYSDLGFMILQQLVERLSQMSLEQYAFTHFYSPMGLHRTSFNPLEKGYEIFEIAPTEYDHRYRRSLVWGDVHDRNAAIFGGVAGHAGLFSSAKDLSVIMHMLLNDGYYAGEQYLQPTTIATFNARYFEGNRRGLGWDKYDSDIENASAKVSPGSFGHTGFTGTMIWADPEHDLVYAFLSNRIYPDARNKKLMRHEFREKIQDAIYSSIMPQE